MQVSGNGDRPRLAVFRSNQHIYAQASLQRSCGVAVLLATTECAVRAHRTYLALFINHSLIALDSGTWSQVIDDVAGRTLASASTVTKELRGELAEKSCADQVSTVCN